MSEKITQHTLFLFFEGRATSLQRKLIEDWLKDSAHEEFYFASLEIWERKHPQLAEETGETQDRFFSYLRGHTPTGKPILAQPKRALFLGTIWPGRLWAASILLTIITGLGYVFKDTVRYQIYTTDFGETRSLQLVDGSRVTLNANSELKVPRWLYGKNDREVWLSGEAEFIVTHTLDHRKFVVRTRPNLSVDVLGTVFSVYDRGTKAAVSLLKGKVNVHYRAQGTPQQLIKLKPGNEVTLDEHGQLALKEKTDPELFSSWKNHQFVFDNSTLSEILQLIQDNYGVTVKLTDSSLGQKRISGTFTAQSAHEFLGVLAQMYTLELQPDHDDFLLISPN